MGQVGPDNWGWVSLDTAGVPHGGPFGDVDGFAADAGRLGYRLAWSVLWECFYLYRLRADGSIHCEHKFWNAITQVPAPLEGDWLPVIEYCRDHKEGKSVDLALAEMKAKRAYEQAVKKLAQREEIWREILSGIELNLGRSPTVMVGGPGGARRKRK